MVCGYDDYEENNKIIYCESCDISLHQNCYGLSFMSSQDISFMDFVCWPCKVFGHREFAMGLKCSICNQIGGALLPSNLLVKQLEQLKAQNFYEEKQIRSCLSQQSKNAVSSHNEVTLLETKLVELCDQKKTKFGGKPAE